MSILSSTTKRLITIFALLAGLSLIPIGFVAKWATTDDPQPSFALNFDERYPPPPEAAESFQLLFGLAASVPEDPLVQSDFETLFEEDPAEKGSFHLKEGISIDELRSNFNDEPVEKAFDEYVFDKLDTDGKLAYLELHRSEVERLWNEIPHLERRLETLADFDSIGGDPTEFPEVTKLNLRNLRQVAKRQSWRARLFASEGDADRALYELHRMIQIANKAMPHTRSLIESLNWNAVSAICLDAATEVAQHNPVSIETLQEGLSVLPSATSPVELFERMLYAETIAYYRSIAIFENRKIAGVFPLALPNASANRMDAFSRELLDCLATGDIESAKSLAEDFAAESKRFALRNPLGRQLGSVLLPSLVELYEIFPKLEAKRSVYLDLIRARLARQQG